MLKVGLTGGIGSGKSTVAAIFATLGIPVSFADEEAKRLMNEDPALREAISREFGGEAYAGGTLNRKWLAAQVFGNPARLEALNRLVHPVTIREGVNWMRKMAGHGHPYAIREAALIFEAHSAGQLDFIVGVYAPEELRIRRTVERDHSQPAAVKQRMRNQMDEDEKMKLCDAVIRNDEQEPLIPQVIALHQRLVSLAPQRTSTT